MPIGDLIDGLMEEWRTWEIKAMTDFNGSCEVSMFNGTGSEFLFLGI